MLITMLFACTDKEMQAEIDVLNITIIEQEAIMNRQEERYNELLLRMDTLETQMNNISGGYTLAELSIRLEDNAAQITGHDLSLYNLETRIGTVEDAFVSTTDIDIYAQKSWVEQKAYAYQADVITNEVALVTQAAAITDNENNISLISTQLTSIQSDYVQNGTLSSYAQKSWVLGQAYTTEIFVTSYPFALETDLETIHTDISAIDTRVVILEEIIITADALSPFATEAWVSEQEFASADISALAQYLSIDTTNHDIVLSGINLHIQSGSGATDDNYASTEALTGLGNLIIGYDENDADIKTGTHNIVMGAHHSYTSYGSFLGGYNNETSAPYASVLSGTENNASQQYATIVGGSHNLSDAEGAHISGGSYGFATGAHSSILGGKQNVASGENAIIIGGESNSAAANFSIVLSGSNSSASGTYSVVSGDNNSAEGSFAHVLGGTENTASGDYSSITAGESNTASGAHAAVHAGTSNTASGDYSSISAGRNNTTSAMGASISGGLNNTASGAHASVTGGEENEATGGAASISGGRDNTASGSHTMHAGGQSLTLSDDYTYSAVNIPYLEDYLSVDTSNHSITFTGANVFVQSGSGYTDDEFSNTGALTGLGNLIIGYDENVGTDAKTGSHNLVVGPHHTYTSYASLIFGYDNSSTGAFGIIGGKQNSATSRNNSIIGGEGHQTSQYGATVLGGRDNVVEGFYGAILGGDSNTITEDYTSIVGGEENLADGAYSSILGGYSNTTNAAYSTISGGTSNTAAGTYSSISGGDTESTSSESEVQP